MIQSHLILSMGTPGWVLAAAAVIVVVAAVGIYNGLVRRRVAVRDGWAQIDVQLQRRHHLIPNLVETVKGYAAHEKTALEGVIAARNQAAAASGPAAVGAAEGLLGAALGRVFALSEAYPDLKANAGFIQLGQELASAENLIGSARAQYNRLVADYNTSITVVPSVILARPLGFREEEFFEIEEPAAREVPKVRF